jgi:hypothetical protein
LGLLGSPELREKNENFEIYTLKSENEGKGGLGVKMPGVHCGRLTGRLGRAGGGEVEGVGCAALGCGGAFGVPVA